MMDMRGMGLKAKYDASGKIVGQTGMTRGDMFDKILEKRTKQTDASLEAQKIMAKGQATAQAQTNAVDTNADTSAVTVAAAGAQIEASSIGSQAIVNAIGEGNQVLASILSQIQGEFAKLPGYEG